MTLKGSREINLANNITKQALPSETKMTTKNNKPEYYELFKLNIIKCALSIKLMRL